MNCYRAGSLLKEALGGSERQWLGAGGMGKARVEYGDMGVQGHGSNPLGSLYLFCGITIHTM